MTIEELKDACCGCGGCAQACPKGAIAMEPDADGFLYPVVDGGKCVDCGLCVKHCPVADPQPHTSFTAYYGWNKDFSIRASSSSGGVFSVFAEQILKENGVVYGAAFDVENKTIVYRGTDCVTLDDLRRSKYVQADTNTVFAEIKTKLAEGRKVLFCGTPCHVAGLKAFLVKEDENLYTCDFVCGGGSSPAFFKEHLQMLEKKYGAPVKQINFRDKKKGWKRMLLTISFGNGKKYSKLSYFDAFFNGFIEGIIKRRNCYSCQFADNHYSDLTIADYWGYRNAGVPYDEKGISMIVVNTEKGQHLHESVAEQMELVEMGLERTRYTIRPRVFSQEKYAKRESFFADAKKMGYEKAARSSYMKHPYIDVLLSYLHLK